MKTSSFFYQLLLSDAVSLSVMWATLTDILVVFLIQTLHFSVVNAAVSYFSCDQEGDKRCCQNNRDGCNDWMLLKRCCGRLVSCRDEADDCILDPFKQTFGLRRTVSLFIGNRHGHRIDGSFCIRDFFFINAAPCFPEMDGSVTVPL